MFGQYQKIEQNVQPETKKVRTIFLQLLLMYNFAVFAYFTFGCGNVTQFCLQYVSIQGVPKALVIFDVFICQLNVAAISTAHCLHHQHAHSIFIF